MSDELKHSIIWAIAITVISCVLFISLAIYHTTTTIKAMESGYSMKSTPGQQWPRWQKD